MGAFIPFGLGRYEMRGEPGAAIPVWVASDAEQRLAAATQEIERLRAEIDAWRGFARHCQRTVAALKSLMTNEQVIQFLGDEMNRQIDMLGSNDTSDIDPDLRDLVQRILDARNGVAG